MASLGVVHEARRRPAAILRSVNFRVRAAPPTSMGGVTPAAVRSSAVVTIWWALFTRSPERPMTSGRCSRNALHEPSRGAP